MTTNPQLRKFALTAHITSSVGWLGAVVAYLALAIVGLTTRDSEMARASYLSMEVLCRFVIAPLSLGTLLAGFVEAFGTPWGLLRHWWVLTKFVLTSGGTIVLFQHMPVVARMSRLAREMTMSATDHRTLRTQLVVHAAGGLLVLLTATVLSVYKPWGLTPYGRRSRHEARSTRPAEASGRREAPLEASSRSAVATGRWTSVVRIHAIHALALGLLFLVVHVAGGGLRSH
jgi:hypothetical protein